MRIISILIKGNDLINASLQSVGINFAVFYVNVIGVNYVFSS